MQYILSKRFKKPAGNMIKVKIITPYSEKIFKIIKKVSQAEEYFFIHTVIEGLDQNNPILHFIMSD